MSISCFSVYDGCGAAFADAQGVCEMNSVAMFFHPVLFSETTVKLFFFCDHLIEGDLVDIDHADLPSVSVFFDALTLFAKIQCDSSADSPLLSPHSHNHWPVN